MLEACDERSRVKFEAPDITVHIRWGNKWIEMGLIDMAVYVAKVHDVIAKHGLPLNAKVFLMTEDYRALDEFKALADPNWQLQVMLSLIKSKK